MATELEQKLSQAIRSMEAQTDISSKLGKRITADVDLILLHLSEHDQIIGSKVDETTYQASVNSLTSLINARATENYVDTGLAGKVDTVTYDAAILAINTALALKVDQTQHDTDLGLKADITYVDDGLALKADLITVNAQLAGKADTTYVDGQLATRVTQTAHDAALLLKADKTYVDTELASKADLVGGKVPSGQLPLDELLQLYSFGSMGEFPVTGIGDRYYLDGPAGKLYYWYSGDYKLLSSGMELGTGEFDAHRGDHGNAAYVHSQEAHAPSDAEANVPPDWDASSGPAAILNKPSSMPADPHTHPITWGTVQLTGYINEFDAVMDWTCPTGSVMVGLYSYHDNGREDRRWKVRYRSISVSS